MRDSGLSRDDVVDKTVRRMARRHEVPLRRVDFKLERDDGKPADPRRSGRRCRTGARPFERLRLWVRTDGRGSG